MNKVCHITTVHQRRDNRIFFKECLSLKKAGFDVSLLVADAKEDEEFDGVHIIDITSGKKIASRLYRFTVLAIKMYKACLRVDASVYHFHDPELMIVGYFLKRRGKQIIYDVHEDLPRDVLSKNYISGWLKKPLSLILEKSEAFFSAKYDQVVTSTEFIKGRFLKINTSTEVICNYPVLAENAFMVSDWSLKKQEICYVGGITEVRGMHEMLDVLALLDCRLNLAGNFVPATLEEEARNHPAWEKVNYWGYCNNEQVKEIYQRSKIGLVLLHPIISFVDSLPVKMFEYMAAGIPVVTTDIPYWRSIVDGSQCGVCVDLSQSRLIAEQIRSLLENDDRSRELGRNGQEAVRFKYNWKTEEQKLVSLYKALEKSRKVKKEQLITGKEDILVS